MKFFLLACLVMHVVSVVAWIGGLIFMNVVLRPVLRFEGLSLTPVAGALQRGFFPFLWSSLWTLLITGVFLALMHPGFRWLDYSTLWSRLLLGKEILFLGLAFTSWQAARVVVRLQESLEQKDSNAEGWQLGFERLVRRSIVLGFLALICACGMAVV